MSVLEILKNNLSFYTCFIDNQISFKNSKIDLGILPVCYMHTMLSFIFKKMSRNFHGQFQNEFMKICVCMYLVTPFSS